MKVLICTVFDIDIPCAGLNRLTSMSKALELYGIQALIVLGSGSYNMQGKIWKYWEEQGQSYILFDKGLFTTKRHCNAMMIAATAAKFYKNHLHEIINKLSISGVIFYSPQYQLLAPFIGTCKRNNVFIIADCGENFSLSIKHLLNGVIYQQLKFRLFQMRKLDGAIISSSRWLSDTENSGTPSCMVPGFLKPQDCYRSSAGVKSDKFVITIMGRFAGREMPSVIIKALEICKNNNLRFEVNFIGTGSGGKMEAYWLKKLINNQNICNDVNVRGYVSSNERDKVLATSDIFIMLRPPSQETEYLFPSRVPEYLSTGNPVILTNTPSLNEFFKQGSGVYFISNKNDSAELANLIMDLADKPLERFESGKKGRMHAVNNFSLDVMGKKLSDFLNVINSK